MLSALLLFAFAPQAAPPSTPDAPVGSAPVATARVFGPMPMVCAPRPTIVSHPAPANNGLVWREGDEPVALYRLLDRRVNGCPAPVIVNYRVPGSNALGREAVAHGRGDRLPTD